MAYNNKLFISLLSAMQVGWESFAPGCRSVQLNSLYTALGQTRLQVGDQARTGPTRQCTLLKEEWSPGQSVPLVVPQVISAVIPLVNASLGGGEGSSPSLHGGGTHSFHPDGKKKHGCQIHPLRIRVKTKAPFGRLGLRRMP